MGTLDHLMTALSANASVLDVGCFGFSQVNRAVRLGRSDLRHSGVDNRDYVSVPERFEFRRQDVDKDGLPFDTDRFDLVIASHVLEHLQAPVNFFGECARVCKPGGVIYVETPSERSLWLPGSPVEHNKFFSLSFFDDPTHVGRPWTPQALHRLATCFGLEVVQTEHITSRKEKLKFPLIAAYVWLTGKHGARLERTAWLAFGWACYMTARKVNQGVPSFNYFIPDER
jgi:SAM-dependent methyltransferase